MVVLYHPGLFQFSGGDRSSLFNKVFPDEQFWHPIDI